MSSQLRRELAVPTVQISNDHVTVTEWCFAPGAETGWHHHQCDYIVVPQKNGELLLETHRGPETARLYTGQAYFKNRDVEHNVVNMSPHDISFVEIEIKRHI